MLRGIQIAARGMTVQMEKSDITANNLANIDTTGFKRDVHTVQAFKEILLDRIEARPFYERSIGYQGFGAVSGPISVDFSSGIIQTTDNPLDFALEGEGFFVIETPSGLCLTRDGSFTLNDFGELVTKNGYRVMGVDGPIWIPPGDEISVKSNGEVFVDEAHVATFLVWKVDERSLVKQGSNMYTLVPGANVEVMDNPCILQGCLERSNVNVVREMLEMIAGMRNFEACQRILHGYDSTLDKCVNEVGKV
jgi:flagellar basal-body rod protein FlgF